MCDYIVTCMKNGDIKAVERYIDTLKSINQYVYEDDENRLNVLHLAVGLDSENREEIVELLISRRVDINCPAKSENTDDIRPLHLASMWGYDMTVKLLLYHGADASLRDSNDLSPVDYASMFDNYYCISILLKYGSLNSTASAWSTIMNSSLGESNLDSSIEDCLYTTALDIGSNKHERSIYHPTNNLFDFVNEESDDEDHNRFRFSSVYTNIKT